MNVVGFEGVKQTQMIFAGEAKLLAGGSLGANFEQDALGSDLIYSKDVGVFDAMGGPVGVSLQAVQNILHQGQGGGNVGIVVHPEGVVHP